MTNIGNYVGLAEAVSTTVPTEEAQLTSEKGRERGKEGGRKGMCGKREGDDYSSILQKRPGHELQFVI